MTSCPNETLGRASIAWVCACTATSVTPVRGPDGGRALLVKAGSQLDALREAHEQCPEGYEILNTTTGVTGTRVAIGSTVEMLISCKRPAHATSEWYVPPDPGPCRSVGPEVDDFVEYWAAFVRAEPVEKSPQGSALVDLCNEMPSRVRHCFHKAYRKAHEKMCTELFKGLDEPRRAKLDTALVQ
jgi:hypothetical protein